MLFLLEGIRVQDRGVCLPIQKMIEVVREWLSAFVGCYFGSQYPASIHVYVSALYRAKS